MAYIAYIEDQLDRYEEQLKLDAEEWVTYTFEREFDEYFEQILFNFNGYLTDEEERNLRNKLEREFKEDLERESVKDIPQRLAEYRSELVKEYFSVA